MRPLTEDEAKLVFEKLMKFVGNIEVLLDRKEEKYVFRLHRGGRVYYMSESGMKQASWIPRKKMMSTGVCLGKLTKARRFNLTITALHILGQYGTYKIWLKEGSEQSFIYGNHVIKRQLGRITEGIPLNAGVIVLTSDDLPIGFGAAAKSTEKMRDAPPEAVVLYNQADVGEYLRHEVDLV